MSEKSTALAVLSGKQREVFESMSAAGQVLFRKVEAKVSSILKSDLVGRHEIGELVKEALTNQTKYGDGIIRQMAEALGGESTESDLYACKRFADSYSREKVLEILARRTEEGGQIGWSHMRTLCLIPATKISNAGEVREELLERAFTESLSQRALQDLVREKVGLAVSATSSRPPVMPRSTYATMQQVDKYRESIVSRAGSWNQVFEKLIETPPEEYSEKLLKQLQDTMAGQQQLRQVADDLASKTSAVIEHIQKVFASRKLVDGEATIDKPAASPRKKAAPAAEKQVVKTPAKVAPAAKPVATKPAAKAVTHAAAVAPRPPMRAAGDKRPAGSVVDKIVSAGRSRPAISSEQLARAQNEFRKLKTVK